jgi:GAF domain-containing protein
MKQRLQLLAEASAVFAEVTPDTSRLIEILARKITDAVGDSCAVLLLDEGSDELRPVAFFHRVPEAQELVWKVFTATPVRLGEGLLGKAAQAETSVLLPVLDTQRVMDTTKPEYRAVVERYPPRTMMAVPLMARGRSLGVIGMTRHDENPYTEDDLRLVEDIAERAAMAIEVAQLLRKERAQTERALALAEASKVIQSLDHQRTATARRRSGCRRS